MMSLAVEITSCSFHGMVLRPQQTDVGGRIQLSTEHAEPSVGGWLKRC